MASCPRCGEEKVENPYTHGTEAAVVVRYRNGDEPWALCRRCMHEWHGRKEIAELAYAVEASSDPEAMARFLAA